MVIKTKLKRINIIFCCILVIMGLTMVYFYESYQVNQSVISSNKQELNNINLTAEAKSVTEKPFQNIKIASKGQSKFNKNDYIASSDIYIPDISPIKDPIVYNGDLNDFEQYQAFESTQNKQLKKNFIDASKNKIAYLNKFVSEAKLKGITEEQLIFAENKIQSLKSLNEVLENELTLKQ